MMTPDLNFNPVPTAATDHLIIHPSITNNRSNTSRLFASEVLPLTAVLVLCHFGAAVRPPERPRGGVSPVIRVMSVRRSVGRVWLGVARFRAPPPPSAAPLWARAGFFRDGASHSDKTRSYEGLTASRRAWERATGTTRRSPESSPESADHVTAQGISIGGSGTRVGLQ